MIIQTGTLEKKFAVIKPLFNEKTLRLWAAAEAKGLGHGGIQTVAKICGLSRRSIERGIKQIDLAADYSTESNTRVRKNGAGRKSLAVTHPHLLDELRKLVDPATRADPMSPLLWTAKSTSNLASELTQMGYPISARTVASLLHKEGYSLQSVRKNLEGGNHPDRNKQFEYISESVKAFQERGEPVISVDTKKKELIVQYANGGREWQPKTHPEQVNVYDFVDKEKGKAIPYGVYDVAANEGWVSVGIDHDTAEFAGESIWRWWCEMGLQRYPNAQRLLITADGGGSNGTRVRLWKKVLQELATKMHLSIHVRHFPPGTSKWNKIEHRMFCQITQNWRGRPLTSKQVIVQLIGQTTSQTGLRIKAKLDEGSYPIGKKVDDGQMKEINLARDDFHGEWNYSIKP